MVTTKSAFIAAGGNRHPSAADWDAAGSILAYGAGRNIATWEPLKSNRRGISSLLSGHTESVNFVKFLKTSFSTSSFLLSGGVDGTIRVWSKNTRTSESYELMKVLERHGKSINCVAVLFEGDIFVSGATDGECRVWQVVLSEAGTDLDVQCIQTITLSPKFFPLALAVARLPSSESMILAVAGSRPFIQIYVSRSSQFQLAATLTGHEGWIRSLDFTQETTKGNSDLLLASASQDKYIRLWRVHEGETLPPRTDASNDPVLGSVGKSLSNKAHRFETKEHKYSATFEALLLGHEDWIFTARWKRVNNQIKLLSASTDNSLSIWEADPVSGVWICTVRLGEISAQKGATTATGSTGGFWIGLWSPQGDAVVSLGRTGSWRLWTYDTTDDHWAQADAVGGHTKEVKALAWAQDGSYLVSTSSDQTTRLFAEWNKSGRRSWHEFSRPQIHGYDLNCIDTVGENQIISGADEKLLRVFREPKSVAELLTQLCGIEIFSIHPLPEAANIPVLGLSNKAIGNSEEEKELDAQQEEDTLNIPSDTAPVELLAPPIEDHLARHLLWPETEKLYGHGYEISALAASHDGSIVATACRASSIDHAVIRLYESTGWREVKPLLTAHSLTVTSLQFSPDDTHLLSVGRDRQCAVFKRSEEQASKYTLLASNPKAHTRMLLDASWAPREAVKVFATAGRDKNVHVWQIVGQELERRATISASLPVTSLAFCQEVVHGNLMLAYGLEDGSILTTQLALDGLQCQAESDALCKEFMPSLAITKLAWRPLAFEKSRGGVHARDGKHQLAVASEDYSVRIFDIDFS